VKLEKQLVIVNEFKQVMPRAMTRKILSEHLGTRRNAWNAPKSFGVDDLIALLRENDIMGIAEISSEHYGSKTRYIFGALSPLQLACFFYKNSYLSHGSALHLHGLAPLETIFVNHEQSPKNSRPRISQAGLNRAFQNSQRQSTYVFRYGTSTITFLNGKNTQGAGIVDMQGPRGEPLKTTSLERTLIDVVVRPQYAGGMSNVLSAFRQAKDRISVAEIARLLAKVKYIYPYHQALGFILQRAGVPEEELAPLKQRAIRLKFYLDYGMNQPAYDPAWKLYYPRDLP
jgi:predicted transcriptional regulator of viral defense system